MLIDEVKSYRGKFSYLYVDVEEHPDMFLVSCFRDLFYILLTILIFSFPGPMVQRVASRLPTS